jgi:succinate dehydrogenase / fumarate reductase membrane anchor subunit
MVRVVACGWFDGSVLGVVVKAGTQHFVAQRVTAVALVFLSLWFIGSISGLASLEYEVVVEFVAGRTNGVLLALLCATLAYHSYLGIEVVIEDYVHGNSIKGASLLASKLAHILIAIASIYATFSIGPGA